MNSEIERLAKEAGFSYFDRISPDLRSMDQRYAKFAALVAEECAKECNRLGEDGKSTSGRIWTGGCAGAIRAKFALSHEKDAAK